MSNDRIQRMTQYERLVKEEIGILGRTGGPLYLVLNPPGELNSTGDYREVDRNFTDDQRDMPPELMGLAVHRYPDRLLVLASSDCFQRCGYCCRPFRRSDTYRTGLGCGNIDRIITYVRKHPEVREIVLSGGDPLTCSDDEIEYALGRLSIESEIRYYRIHTRGIIYAPARLTSRLIDAMVTHSVRVVLHAVHPYEIIPETVEAIHRLRNAGIQLFNQFPLLRGINDHPVVMERLIRILAVMGVVTASIYVPEPVGESFGYRIGLERVYRMTDELKDALPSWMSLFDVCLDTPIGKVRRNHIISHDSSRNTYLFQRNLRRFEYQDISSKNDLPTDLGSLLYRTIDTVSTRNPVPYSSG